MVTKMIARRIAEQFSGLSQALYQPTYARAHNNL